MPILIMFLLALAVFGVIGILLGVAQACERKKSEHIPKPVA